jgi:CheY-like chemotaxis protein/MinD-like ATPase involved in chromosome partitioning or flagellar assembly
MSYGPAKLQTILLVDDELKVRSAIGMMLRHSGYHGETAKRGSEGIKQVAAIGPDLVLMDVVMPGMDGFEATQRIRRLPEGRKIPIIFLSAEAEVEQVIKGLRVGGDDDITKPVQMGELLARIEARLRSDAKASGELITLFGGKDGVGTTTLALNLALALRKVSQESIALLDWQRPLGDIAPFLNLRMTGTLDALLAQIDELDEGGLGSALREWTPGVEILTGATEQKSASRMNQKSFDQIRSLAIGKARYVLVDMGTFPPREYPKQVVEQGISLLLLDPDRVSIRPAARARGGMTEPKLDFWFVLNRSGMPGGGSPDQVEQHLKTPLKPVLPDVGARTIRALNLGRALYQISPESTYSRAVEGIAHQTHKALS